jgi:alpha-L-fucosidase
VGNEHGEAAETSWATYEPKPREGSKKAGPGESDYHNSPTGTLNGKYWIPAECDVPLRPGWFYHPEQDAKVKTPEKLFDIYLKSVGRGGALDLGLSPDKRGLLHENDVKALAGFGEILTNTFGNDLAKTSKTSKALTDGDKYSYVAGNQFLLEWAEPQTFDVLRIRENIKLGQRVQEFVAEAWINGQWQEFTKATSVGNARILTFPAVTTQKVRVRIVKSGATPAISEIGLFKKR